MQYHTTFKEIKYQLQMNSLPVQGISLQFQVQSLFLHDSFLRTQLNPSSFKAFELFNSSFFINSACLIVSIISSCNISFSKI
jgi:hypothetical protein